MTKGLSASRFTDIVATSEVSSCSVIMGSRRTGLFGVCSVCSVFSRARFSVLNLRSRQRRRAFSSPFLFLAASIDRVCEAFSARNEVKASLDSQASL